MISFEHRLQYALAKFMKICVYMECVVFKETDREWSSSWQPLEWTYYLWLDRSALCPLPGNPPCTPRQATLLVTNAYFQYLSPPRFAQGADNTFTSGNDCSYVPRTKWSDRKMQMVVTTMGVFLPLMLPVLVWGIFYGTLMYKKLLNEYFPVY